MSLGVEALERRIAQLEQENQELRRLLAETEKINRVAHLIQTAVGAAPIVFYVKDGAGRFLYSNPRHATLVGQAPEEIVSKTERDLVDPDVARHIERITRRVMTNRQAESAEVEISLPSGPRNFHETIFPLHDGEEVVGVGGVAIDVTARKTAEHLVEAQRALIQDLSAPLIPIAEGVLAVPLIGTIDAQRMTEITNLLLHKIVEQQIGLVLLDLTGIRQLDADSAAGIVHLAHAVRLLGAKVSLTGIRPDVARLLINDGIDLGGIATFGALHMGIASAMSRRHGPPKGSPR